MRLWSVILPLPYRRQVSRQIASRSKLRIRSLCMATSVPCYEHRPPDLHPCSMFNAHRNRGAGMDSSRSAIGKLCWHGCGGSVTFTGYEKIIRLYVEYGCGGGRVVVDGGIPSRGANARSHRSGFTPLGTAGADPNGDLANLHGPGHWSLVTGHWSLVKKKRSPNLPLSQ
jgi:hypothetical protein